MNDGVTTELKSAPTTTGAGWLAQLEIADGLYLVVAIAAAVMRFVDLGRLPLSAGEAMEALAAWQFWQPGQMDVAPGSMAYFSFTALATQFLGFSDAVMRLVPALFGFGLVLLPWLLRHRLGKVGMLLCGSLLAVSPLNSVVSRTAGGETIALFALLLIFVAWMRLRESGEERWRLLAAVGLALGLTSAPIFYSGLLSLGFAWLIQSRIAPRPSEAKGRVWNQAGWRGALLFGGISFLAISTLLFWYPAGLGSSARILADWWSQFTLKGGLAQIVEPLLVAGRYEILLFLPGFAALIWAAASKDFLGTFCLYWVGGLLLLLFLQQGQTNLALLLTLPGYFLLARFSAALLQNEVDATAWGLAGVVLLMGMLIGVNIGRYSRVIVYEPQQLTHVWIALFALSIGLATIYFVGTWHVTAAYQGALIGALTLLIFYQWGTGWWLGHFAANDPRERWVIEGTDDEVRMLAGVARDVSRQITGSDDGLDIFALTQSPVLRWYLRQFKKLHFGEVIPADARNAAIISPVENNLSPGSDYLGADFGLLRTLSQGSVQPAGAAGLVDSIRWWLFHQSAATVGSRRVVFWWRSDLIRGVD